MAGMAARAAITAAEAAIWRMDFISNVLWSKGGPAAETAKLNVLPNTRRLCAIAAN
jgi:hypothetical protein